jgi:N-methylhydantoinase A
VQGGVRIGIDIGGTFTDLLLFDEATGGLTIGKTLTTPGDPSDGVQSGLEQVLSASGKRPETISRIVHGTTLITNALIERKGAETALVTTAGFRDAVEIGREHRYDLYDLFLELPAPLVPRRLRFEADERILADGSVDQPLDLEALDALIDRIVAEGIEAVAIAFLHSYQNPAHERIAAERFEQRAPEIVLSLSSEVVPEIREYERISTTIANVYARPLVRRYLADLETMLAGIGVTGPLFVMLSSGGICTVETASRFPIRLIESGPAAGALAAARYGQLTGRPSLLSFDMGGTTAKCCLIDGGKPALSAEFEVSRVYRFKKGSGLPIKVPVIEMIEIGAGGGSIARVDALGLLKIGPDSAGADPGPACYGRGGADATVTDADLVLGFLDPEFFLGGRMRLDLDAANAAIERLAGEIGLSPLETAWGIHQLVNEQMAAAARMHAIEQGKDPRAYPLFAFGGAGPVHAYRVAEILRQREVIVPLGAGITSTVGFLAAPLAFDFVRTYIGRLDALDWDAVNARFAEMESEGRAILTAAGVPDAEIGVSRTAELRYAGQGHEVTIPIPSQSLGAHSAVELAAEFESTYRRLYGRTAEGNPLEAVNWRAVVSGPPPHLDLARVLDWTDPRGSEQKGRRAAYMPELGGFVDVAVVDRYQLAPGAEIDGPVIIEERESTTVIGHGARVAVDELLDLVITLPARSDADETDGNRAR